MAHDCSEVIRKAQPDLPEALHDRAQDNWEPLLAIAALAGDEWAQLARKTALTLSADNDNNQSRGVELLSDIREIFEERQIDRIHTADLVEALCDDLEKSWATYYRGNPITQKQLSTRLSEYGIRSKSIRVNAINKKGFEKSQFEDVFARYLSSSAQSSETSVTSSQISADASVNVRNDDFTDAGITQNVTRRTSADATCDDVTEEKVFSGDEDVLYQSEDRRSRRLMNNNSYARKDD